MRAMLADCSTTPSTKQASVGWPACRNVTRRSELHSRRDRAAVAHLLRATSAQRLTLRQMGRIAIGMLVAASVAAACGVASTVFTYEPVFPAASPDARHIAWVDIAGVGGADRVFVAGPD